MKAIQFTRFGGPDVLEVVERPTPPLQHGEVLVDVSRAGVNFADTLMRQDRYAVHPDLPCVPGIEAVGRVANANGSPALAIGQRVAVPLFALGRMTGGYAQQVAAPAEFVVPLPDAIDDDQALALQVQGLTALALTRHVGVRDKTVLVSAAAGGVGTLLTQLLRLAGAKLVIAATGSPEKGKLAMTCGAHVSVNYAQAGWTTAVREVTNGEGPDVVFESAGGAVTADSLSVLAPNGVMVIYGALNIQQFALGVPELLQLIFRNQSVRGFALVPLLTPQLLRRDLAELFDLTARGTLVVHVGGRYPMQEVAAAHAAMELRKTTGKVTLQMR